jgi:hypothetical protein
VRSGSNLGLGRAFGPLGCAESTQVTCGHQSQPNGLAFLGTFVALYNTRKSGFAKTLAHISYPSCGSWQRALLLFLLAPLT